MKEQPIAIRALVRRAIEAFAERTAIETPAAKVSYHALGERAERVSALLGRHGIGAGHVVLVAVEERAELIAALLGVLRAGAIFAPIEPDAPPARLAAIAHAVAGASILFERQLGDLARELEAAAGCGPARAATWCGDLGLLAGRTGEDAELAASMIGSRDPCYLYFTSGSTGVPKGVLGSERSLAHFVRWEIRQLGLDSACRVSQLTPPGFDPFLRDVFVPLAAGGTICIPAGRETILDGERLARWLRGQRVHLTHLVPSVFRALLAAGEPCGALAHVLLAGERLLPSDVAEWIERGGEPAQLINLYGPTEATLAKLFHPVRSEDALARSVPIGTPIPGVRALVLDDAGAPCAPGATGEIHIRTPFLSLGYYKRRDLTERAFIANPFGDSPEDRVYRTGDLGRVRPDGRFEFAGRRDEQVKIRGSRIELGEVETALRRHPAVRDAAVVDRVDARGEGRLVAFVVAGRIEEGELRAFLARYLDAAATPSAIVPVEALPRTRSGKVDRRALKLDVALPSAPPARLPHTHVERTIAAIWSELLGLAEIGAEQDFFALGGHSLAAARMMARVRARFAIELPLRLAFEQPTVAGLAGAVEEARASRATGAADPIPRLARPPRAADSDPARD